jgi:uncharacterized membrane protein
VQLLDWLRLLAAVQMVQGHTIDAVLSVDYRHGALHQGWLWLRGLTSVAFFTTAGMAFQLATFRDGSARRDAAAVLARFRRAGTLVLLGYVLRMPLPWYGHSDLAAALSSSLAIDALQCIGVSLALLEGLALLVPDARAFALSCAVLAVAVLACSPRLSLLDPHGPWLPLLDYLTPRGGSAFPLAPFVVHVLLGAALAPQLLGGRWRTARLLVAAASLLVLAGLLRAAAPPLATYHLSRFAWVLLGLGLLSPLERWLPARAAPLQLSRETLFIYGFHVLLVYGQGLGLAALIGRRLAPGPAVLTALCVLGLTLLCALGYRRALAGLARSTATG